LMMKPLMMITRIIIIIIIIIIAVYCQMVRNSTVSD
jgi:hypothetical protein